MKFLTNDANYMAAGALICLKIVALCHFELLKVCSDRLIRKRFVELRTSSSQASFFMSCGLIFMNKLISKTLIRILVFVTPV